MFTASSWVAKIAVKMGREEEGRKGIEEEEEPGTKEHPNCLLEWVVQVLSGHPCDTQIVSCAFLCHQTFHVLRPYEEESLLLLLLLLLLPHAFLRFFPSFLLTWIFFLQPLSAGILLLSVAAATASHLISAQNLAANPDYYCYCKCCFCLLGSAVH
jgi:hypothetical protein